VRDDDGMDYKEEIIIAHNLLVPMLPRLNLHLQIHTYHHHHYQQQQHKPWAQYFLESDTFLIICSIHFDSNFQLVQSGV